MKIERIKAAGLVAGALSVALCLRPAAGTTPRASRPDRAGGAEDVKLTVSLFGTFGYEESGLFDEYEASHPGITITYESTQQEDEYWPALQTRLNAGSGVADIQGIEVARIRDVANNQADKWSDLTTPAAADQIGRSGVEVGPAATTPDGKVLGMGTDIGPMAICYRTDLLEQAGLPTDPRRARRPDGPWDDYVELGREYMAGARPAPPGPTSASGLYNAIISTEQRSTTTSRGELVWDDQPGREEGVRHRRRGRAGRADREARAVLDPSGTRASSPARSPRSRARPG